MQPPPLGCILHCALPGIALRAGGEIVGDLILRAELTPLRNGGINKSLLFYGATAIDKFKFKIIFHGTSIRTALVHLF